MASPQFGAIERKPLRDFWPNEAADFTPWLAENLPFLGDVLGLRLELQDVESPVGPYSADIVCRIVDQEHKVVIENQLEQTDHDHLGKLLTYAAGLGDVSTVVWIAREFTEEHRAALDWLNNSTTQDVGFFGLAIEVWQIGDSLPAPRLTLVAKPNDWSKTPPPQGLSSLQATRLAFWTAFKDFAASEGTKLWLSRPPESSSLSSSYWPPSMYLAAVASALGDPAGLNAGSHIRVEAILYGDQSEAWYGKLGAKRDGIESALGDRTTWYEADETGMRSRIYVSKDADITDRDDWPNQHRWLLEWLQKFDDVFRPLVQNLDA